MKKKDIKIGAEYAVFTGWRMKQSASAFGHSRNDVARARVVAIHDGDPRKLRGAMEEKYGRRRYDQEQCEIEVEILEQFDYQDNSTTEVEQPERLLATRKILIPWDEYVAGKAEQARRRVEYERKREADIAALNRKAEKLAGLVERLGLDSMGLLKKDPLFKLSVNSHQGTGQVYLHGKADDLIALLERLEKAEATAKEAVA